MSAYLAFVPASIDNLMMTNDTMEKDLLLKALTTENVKREQTMEDNQEMKKRCKNERKSTNRIGQFFSKMSTSFKRTQIP
jgi:hypothetical protein